MRIMMLVLKIHDEILPQKEPGTQATWIWVLIFLLFQVAWLLLYFIIFESFGLTI